VGSSGRKSNLGLEIARIQLGENLKKSEIKHKDYCGLVAKGVSKMGKSGNPPPGKALQVLNRGRPLERDLLKSSKEKTENARPHNPKGDQEILWDTKELRSNIHSPFWEIGE